MRYVYAILLAMIIALGMAIPSITKVVAEKPLIVVIADGALEPDDQLKYMMGNITEVEWKLYMDSDEMTFDDIKDAVMIIYVQVDLDKNISDKALEVIKKWFDQGGKTIWVTGDSDYKGGDFKRIPNANKILEALGSHLRNDHTEAVDRESNCGKSYRVAAIIDPDPELSFLKVEKPVLFHGPGVVAVVTEEGKWVPFYGKGEKPLPNLYRIARTSDKGAISEFVPPLPKAYEVGQEGSFVLMAAEYFPDKDNMVILSVEAPFDHYRGMWIDEYHDVPLDGTLFVKKIVLWGARLLGPVLIKPITIAVEKTVTMVKTSTVYKTVTKAEIVEKTIHHTKTVEKTRTEIVTKSIPYTVTEYTTITKEVIPAYMYAVVVLLIIVAIATPFIVKKK